MKEEADPVSVEQITAWLVSSLAETLEIPPEEVDLRQPFSEFGLSSVDAVSLAGDLENWLQRKLSPTLAWEYPTIESLAGYLAQAQEFRQQALEAVNKPEEGSPVSLEFKNEPMAVIGIGCRFPGASGPQAFWQLLRDGVDAIREVPADRWSNQRYYDPDPGVPGKMNTRWGGFLEGVDQFDAHFFGISPREAARMDPQQRMLLEVAWEALEDAGQVREHLSGSNTGVFIGILGNEYSYTQLTHPELIDAYAGTGNALSIAANRISYLFDFQGPSLALDTACSSSLVAVHLACASLASGECSLALAGGANLILSPAMGINFTKAGAMAPDGRCKTFDARADGYVRSEGIGLVVLKPLALALADSDPIYAVILGSAINQDGRSNGLMAPNQHAQEAVIREACRRAGISPGEVQYVEAHGTGTFLGDPIEAQALGIVMADGRSPGNYCVLGSVKTNIGHTEAAAGVAGLIKTALALRHAEIPPNLHFEAPNPHIPFDDLKLRVAQVWEPWPGIDGRRLAGVSSFGFGGTNAHIVLDEAPAAALSGGLEEDTAQAYRAYLLPLSAHSAAALADTAADYRDFLTNAHSATSLGDICYTAALRRSHHEHRLAVIGYSQQEMARRLQAYTQGELPVGLHSGASGKGQHRKLVFVFPGQGAQWAGMGRELLTCEPVFRDMLNTCDRLIQDEAGWSVLEALAADDENWRMADISMLQPALFSMQVGLAALWQHWGIRPDAVVGHSMGEVAAACIAGTLRLPDAVHLICRRSELLKRTSGQGAMLAAGLSLAEAEGRIANYAGQICIAVSNSPVSTVLSGDPAAIQELADSLIADHIFCRQVKVDVAAHSSQVEPLVPELVAALQDLTIQPASTPFYSTVTGGPTDGKQLDAAYWGHNMRQPVLFATATERLVRDGYDVFLEISPHPILLPAIQEELSTLGATGLALPSLQRDEAERASLLASLGGLYTVGILPDWQALFTAGGRHVSLPTYPWQHRRYWLADEMELAGADRTIYTAPAAPASQQGADFHDWLYQLEWRPLDKPIPPAAPPPVKDTTWIIFADQGGTGQALAQAMELHGVRCVLAFAGTTYTTVPAAAPAAATVPGQASSAPSYRLDPACPADFRRLLVDVLAADGRPCGGIVHLWSLDAAPTAVLESLPLEESIRQLEAAQRLGAGSALHLIQALAAHYYGASIPSPAVWWVTRGSASIDASIDLAVTAAGATETNEAFATSSGIAIAQAPLWGLARTAALEHPDLWGGLMDLDPNVSGGASGGEAEQLLEQIWHPDGEDQLAWRGGQRYAGRLRRYRQDMDHEDYTFRSEAAYLITGGLGGLGLEAARWLVDQGACRLVLTSRTGLPARAGWDAVEAGTPLADQITAVRELEVKGATIEVVAADVADEAQMASLINRFRQEGAPPLAGVLHLAGLIDVQPLSKMDTSSLQDVLRPKVCGAWLLHRLTKDLDLDFFVLFSSATSILTLPFLSSYAASNAFLDILAHYRRAMATPAQSINWGFWSQAGMLARAQGETGRDLIPRGIGAFSPDDGLQVLGLLLQHNPVQALVLPVDWEELRQSYPELTSIALFSELTPQQERKWVIEGTQRNTLPGIALGASPEELEAYLRQSIARTLRVDTRDINADQNLMEMGLDSLMIMELVRDMERKYGIRVYPREFFEQPSLQALAVYLSGQLNSRMAHQPAIAATNLTQPGEPGPAATQSMLNLIGYGMQADLTVPERRLPGIAFLLSTPRSGSTLLRVMLAGHSRLFCPPELHLLPFRDLSSRHEALGATYLEEGLQRALMELLSLNSDQSKALLDEWTGQNLPIQEVYAKLQELAGQRLLVDKTPSYASNLDTLERAEVLFEDAKYIFLVRHPYAVIESSVRNRLDKLIGAGESDPFFLAEQNWALSNANVLDFLVSIPGDRYRLVRYEDLVRDPAHISRGLCEFLGIPFEVALLTPYKGGRMTDGVHAVSFGINDPNFLTHDRIDSSLGEVWRTIKLPRRLGGFARRVASELHYELPQESQAGIRQAPVGGSLPAEGSDEWMISGINAPVSALVPIQPLGYKSPIYLVHAAGGTVYNFYELARAMDQDRPVYALQDLSIEGYREPHEQIGDYAEEYIQVIRSAQPQGPYLIGGWSFGGNVAVEMARRLVEAGDTVGLLALIDTEAPVAGRSLSMAQRLRHFTNGLMEFLTGLPDLALYIRDAFYLLAEAGGRVKGSSETRMSSLEYVRYVWTVATYRRLARGAGMGELLRREKQFKRVPLPNATLRRGLHVYRRHLLISRQFEPRFYPGKITLLRADQQIRRQYYSDATLGWTGLAGEVDVRSIPGNHISLGREPHVHSLAAVLGKCLDEADQESEAVPPPHQAPKVQTARLERADAPGVMGMDTTSSALVPIQPLGDKRPVFFIHPGSGIVYCYYELARALGQDRPFCALQDLSLEGQREPHKRIEDYVEEYLQVICTAQPHGPYLIGGWSFGGDIAVEIARRLGQKGEIVALLIVVDTEAPAGGRSHSMLQRLTHIKNFVLDAADMVPDSIPYIRDGLRFLKEARKSPQDSAEPKMSAIEYLQYAQFDSMRRRLTGGEEALEAPAAGGQPKRVLMPNTTLRRALHVLRRHLAVVRCFHPQFYPGKITLLRAEKQIRRRYYIDATLGWEGLAGEVDVRSIPGNHATILREPHVQHVAEVLRQCLDEAEAEYTDTATVKD